MRKEKKKKYYISKHSPILYKQRQRIKISGSRDRALAVFLCAMKTSEQLQTVISKTC